MFRFLWNLNENDVPKKWTLWANLLWLFLVASVVEVVVRVAGDGDLRWCSLDPDDGLQVNTDEMQWSGSTCSSFGSPNPYSEMVAVWALSFTSHLHHFHRILRYRFILMFFGIVIIVLVTELDLEVELTFGPWSCGGCLWRVVVEGGRETKSGKDCFVSIFKFDLLCKYYNLT